MSRSWTTCVCIRQQNITQIYDPFYSPYTTRTRFAHRIRRHSITTEYRQRATRCLFRTSALFALTHARFRMVGPGWFLSMRPQKTAMRGSIRCVVINLDAGMARSWNSTAPHRIKMAWSQAKPDYPQSAAQAHQALFAQDHHHLWPTCCIFWCVLLYMCSIIESRVPKRSWVGVFLSCACVCLCLAVCV